MRVPDQAHVLQLRDRPIRLRGIDIPVAQESPKRVQGLWFDQLRRMKASSSAPESWWVTASTPVGGRAGTRPEPTRQRRSTSVSVLTDERRDRRTLVRLSLGDPHRWLISPTLSTARPASGHSRPRQTPGRAGSCLRKQRSRLVAKPLVRNAAVGMRMGSSTLRTRLMFPVSDEQQQRA